MKMKKMIALGSLMMISSWLTGCSGSVTSSPTTASAAESSANPSQANPDFCGSVSPDDQDSIWSKVCNDVLLTDDDKIALQKIPCQGLYDLLDFIEPEEAAATDPVGSWNSLDDTQQKNVALIKFELRLKFCER